jgi:cobalt-zinc-cadmium efflux system outer membrane protein
MSRPLIVVSGLLLLSGCIHNVRQCTDKTVCNLAAIPYDPAPTAAPQAKSDSKPANAPEATAKTVSTSTKASEPLAYPAVDTLTSSITQTSLQQPAESKPRLEPKIPPEVPGSETPLIKPLPREAAARQRALEQLYPELPKLPEAPVAKPGPNEQPYTLALLQQIAAQNSSTLRAAAADVQTARGNVIQARAYPNPTVGWNAQPSNDGSTTGVQGPFIDQTVKFAGKLKLASAAAEMDLRNAELALKRARSDLSTAVRNAYFGLLVAKETVRVNKGLAQFTDDIYRLHIAGQLGVGAAAAYEPAALRAQAYSTRLAYAQSIQAYNYAWKTLVATIGLRQLPLSEVAGRIDAFIPYYEYDKVLAYALQNHTDVLTARNGLEKARYSLKLAQITPYPDVDFNVSFLKEFAVAPKQFVHTATVGFALPVWDQNQGAIIAAEGTLLHSTEEPHRVETNLTNQLATAYGSYKQNLDGLEYYRHYILPDQVKYYRGVLDRRQIDINAQFGDLVTAQQTLTTNVASYLGILSSLWSSVVSVADLLQTDDLFQVATPKDVPSLPDLDHLLPWPCCHDCPPAATKLQSCR